MSDKKKELLDEYGLPRYLDKQAEMGHTKHIGGAQATRELLEICQVNPDKVLLNVGFGCSNLRTFHSLTYHSQIKSDGLHNPSPKGRIDLIEGCEQFK